MSSARKIALVQGSGCQGCRSDGTRTIPFTMAFQPILDLSSGKVFGYEALVRGVDGQGAGWVLSQIDDDNRYWFDQACRAKAVELAARLGLRAKLSINFLPNAVYEPQACIRATLEAAERFDFDPRQIMFEITEGEEVLDVAHVKRILEAYRALGFTTALDDFGAGYAGLGLLADFQPDVLKLDMKLIRGIDHDENRRVIVEGMYAVASRLRVRLLAEGVETEAELLSLRTIGIDLFQGYYFAKPAFEALPEVAGFSQAA